MPATYVPATDAPDSAAALEAAQKAAKELKLEGLVEMSAVRKAYPLGPGPYVLCVRGAQSISEVRRTYATFLRGNQYVATRTAVIIDDCESQPFTPLR